MLQCVTNDIQHTEHYKTLKQEADRCASRRGKHKVSVWEAWRGKQNALYLKLFFFNVWRIILVFLKVYLLHITYALWYRVPGLCKHLEMWNLPETSDTSQWTNSPVLFLRKLHHVYVLTVEKKENTQKRCCKKFKSKWGVVDRYSRTGREWRGKNVHCDEDCLVAFCIHEAFLVHIKIK